MPPPASRARRVAEARRDVLSSMVPEGAEDNVDALQRAAERLEADAARTRRDLLVAASRVLGDPEGSHYVSVADSDARDARVVAALVDIVPRGGAPPRATPGDAGGGVDDAREESTAGKTETRSRSGAPPAWAATSDAATREEDTALSDAAAALREARGRRDVHTALAARRKQAGLSAAAAEDADKMLRRGDLAGAAAAAAAAAGAAADLRRALAEDRDASLGRGSSLSWDALCVSELDREAASVTSAAEDLFGRIRDAVEQTLRSAARVLEEEEHYDAAALDGGRRFVVDPEALESVWLAFSCSVSTASTEVNEASSKSAALPKDFVSRCLQTLNDELAMELFLPLADAAAEDDKLVSATVEVRNRNEVVFIWRAVEEISQVIDEPSGELPAEPSSSDPSERCAVALATALQNALDFCGQHMRLAGRPVIAKDLLSSTWEAVAAATQSRWFDDDGSALGSSSSMTQPRLSDDAVARLCAAESVAASLGASPAPPAAGPVELAAFERERRAADKVVAAALEEASKVVAEGERDRATARAGTGSRSRSNAAGSNENNVDAGSAESVADAAFFEYVGGNERLQTERPYGQNPPCLPFPDCVVSVSAARLSGLVAATLFRASSLRRRTAAEGQIKKSESAVQNDVNVSPAFLRALELESLTTEKAACDIIEYWRAALPALRRPGGRGDAAAAIAAGGYAAAATFRNDAYFLCSRFISAAYAFGFCESAAEDGDVEDGESLSSRNEKECVRPRHPNVMWVIPPLLRLGDETLDALVYEASREIAAETAAFGDVFARGLDRRDDADEATRAVRRARRCLGSAIFALHECLPEPVARTHVASLLRRYANDVLRRVFASTDVSSDACDAARETLREAFAEEGVLPFDRAYSSAPLEARREASKKQFAAILEKTPSDCGELWRKGQAAGGLFDASLGDIGDGIEDGRWFRLGFEPGEIRALLLAVFEDSHRRREVLEMLA
jgi:hypothetical protein